MNHSLTNLADLNNNGTAERQLAPKFESEMKSA